MLNSREGEPRSEAESAQARQRLAAELAGQPSREGEPRSAAESAQARQRLAAELAG